MKETQLFKYFIKNDKNQIIEGLELEIQSSLRKIF